MDKDLHAFVDRLQAAGQLVRITTPVSRDLEITEIADRVSKGPAASNRALLFEHVTGFEHAGGHQPVRLAAAHGLGAGRRRPRSSWRSGWARCSTCACRRAWAGCSPVGRICWPRCARSASVRRRCAARRCRRSSRRTRPRSTRLPILTCWPDDGGRYITLPQVVTRDPETGTRNVGMYRLQVVDERRLLMHWQRHKGGAEHERVARAARSRPSRRPSCSAATRPRCGAPPRRCPPNIDEYLLAGWLRGKPVEFVECVSDAAGGAGPGRDRHRGLRRSERAPARRSLRRPHRLLHPGRAVPGLSRHGHHTAQGRHLPHHRRRASRRWRTPGWARPPSGCSCR